MTLNSGSLTILPNPTNASIARLPENSANAPISIGSVALTVGSVGPSDTVRASDVYFGSDSVLDVDVSAISAAKPAIKGNGGRVTVKSGSTFAVNNAKTSSLFGRSQ